jgi:hypothetical protein
MSIRFVCRNGHVLKADVRHAGRKTHCPRCNVSVWVPQPKQRTPQAQGALTDTQAVRLLGSYSPRRRHLLATPASEERPCPKCRELVPMLCRVCPSCNTYLGS